MLDNPTSSGVELKVFFKMCYDNAIISSEAQLKQNLLEVIDHKVIHIFIEFNIKLGYQGEKGR